MPSYRARLRRQHKMFDCASRRALAVVCIGLLAGGMLAGCKKDPPPKAVARYQPLPLKNVPEYMKGTIFERTELQNTEYFPVSGYGLVANLKSTGDGTAPTAVREYMINLMVKRGVGSKSMPGWENLQPERIINDKRFAIVEVYGYIPPGARKDQYFDAQVLALPNNDTSSLAHGDLYRTDLRINGANPSDPAGSVNVFARAEGQIFVNPAYAFDSQNGKTASGRASLRNGIVLDGAVSLSDRPLILRLIQPQRSVSRQIEWRIDQRFQDTTVAAARDEGIVNFFVPKQYVGDWEHFANVVTHLYFAGGADFSARKAKELAAAAQEPGAALMDISYCWEGLGTPALPFVRPLMESDKPDVAYAAARAAAFIGDSSAESALMQIAMTKDHPFQINAVQTLGAMESSPVINQMIRKLLDSPQSLVRIEAYKVLAKNRDTSIFSKVIKEKFILDIVPSNQPPIIYATRSGLPRIAIIGEHASLTQPITFTAMENQFSISTAEGGKDVMLFYRSVDLAKPVQAMSHADLAEIVARLGGEGPIDLPAFDFAYGDIVGILQALGDSKRLIGVTTKAGEELAAAFVLQQLPQAENDIYNAPVIGVDANTNNTNRSRPQGDNETPGVGIPEPASPTTAPSDTRMMGAARPQ